MLRIFFLLFLVLHVSKAYADNALIATAANFTHTARTLQKAFEQEYAHSVQLSFGSTGKLYAQIVNGAPYDIFLAADIERPTQLASDGFAVANSKFTYALGQLVLWSLFEDISGDGLSGNGLSTIKRFAIANPSIAPYGRAAKEVLQAYNLYQSYQGKLVQGDSISQAFQFVATGNAGAGLIARAQLSQWVGRKGYAWHVPTDLHQPIEQQAVLLARAERNQAASAFIEFLKSPKARNIIQQQGYALPPLVHE